MSWDIAFFLTSDGLANGSIYLLAGLGLVLIFSVTRVVFIPFGTIAVLAAFSQAAFESGEVPSTIRMIVFLIAIALVTELSSLIRTRNARHIPKALLLWGVLPLIPCGIAWAIGTINAPQLVQIAAAILLVVPVAPVVARVAFQPIADASVLVLLIVALALEFVLSGIALLSFGPQGIRTNPLVAGSVILGDGLVISAQAILLISAAIVISGLFFLVFERTSMGKALRATAINRVGARLVGIRPARSAMLAYGCASLLAGVIGILIAPDTTMYYNSGFLLGLKAFVAAIIGGLVSYPITAIGALAVGVLESFSSFFNGALKDAILFGMLIPILLVRSYMARGHEEEAEEIDQ